VNNCNHDHDDFLNEIDTNLAKSRDVFNQLNAKMRHIDELQWNEIKENVWRFNS
jgi:hypothetical protein